jgi:hypothetical protein
MVDACAVPPVPDTVITADDFNHNFFFGFSNCNDKKYFKPNVNIEQAS